MARLHWAAALVILSPLLGAGGGAESRPADQTLYVRAIGNDGTRLVVTRGPDLPAESFSHVDARLSQQRGKTYTISAELHAPNKSPLILATCVRTESKLTPLVDQTVAVFDARVDPGVVSIAIGLGPRMSIWQIRSIGFPPTKWLDFDKPWTANAVRPRIADATLAVHLGRTKNGRLTAEIIDKAHPSVYEHTLYEQPDLAAASLKRVRQWSALPGQ